MTSHPLDPSADASARESTTEPTVGPTSPSVPASASPSGSGGEAGSGEPGVGGAGVSTAPDDPAHGASSVPIGTRPPAARSVARPGASASLGAASAALRVLHGVELEVAVELGRVRLPVRDLLALGPGSVVELDRPAGGPVDVVVNGTLLARGEVVVVDDEFGVRLTEVVASDAVGWGHAG